MSLHPLTLDEAPAGLLKISKADVQVIKPTQGEEEMSENDRKGTKSEAPGRIIAIAIVILAGAVLTRAGDMDISQCGAGFMIIGGIVFVAEYLLSCVRDVNARREHNSRQLPPLK